MTTIFLEIVIPAPDLTESFLNQRVEVDEQLHIELAKHNLGGLTGRGISPTTMNFNVEIRREADIPRALSLFRRVLEAHGMAKGAVAHQYQPSPQLYKLDD